MSVEDDIQEIRKEIIESHNLVIKTDNLVKNLSVEVKQILKKQDTYERKYWVNSVWAYIIIAALCFIGVYIGFEAKVDAVRRERDVLTEKLQKSQTEAEELQGKLSVRAQQEKAAEHLLALKRENRDDEALRVAEELDVNKMSPVLGRLVTRESDELRQKIGQDALDKGKNFVKGGYLKRAEQEFDRAVSVRPPGPLLAEAHFQRANLMLKLNKSAQAARDFLAAAEADPQSPNADGALFQGASSLENAGDVPQAIEAYKKLLTDYPMSRNAAGTRFRLQKLAPNVALSPGAGPRPPAPIAPAGPRPSAPAAFAPAASAPAASTPMPAPMPARPKPPAPASPTAPAPPADTAPVQPPEE